MKRTLRFVIIPRLLMLWQASLGVQIPRSIDTGIDVITAENVDSFLASG
jgi:hypothetical protein